MAFQDYILLDGKKYKVVDMPGGESYQPIHDRFRRYTVGLTGLSIIQDLTPSGREPQSWRFRFKMFISDPWPDATYGTFSDFMTAYAKPAIAFTEHNDTVTHVIGILNAVAEEPRVGANIEGICNGVVYINTAMEKLYGHVAS
ncbi:MAG: hypothetical protein GY796_25330 [Chloroflexi bacterium]|nr:hypothetical protein [Chloroflexota bacterium]